MILVKRTTSDNADFRKLIVELDKDLNGRYGKDQEVYDQYNVIDYIDTVVVAHDDDSAAGCGCFKKYDDKTIEIKRMFVKSEFRGRGISKLVLSELEAWAKQLGYASAILETGVYQHEALGLYEKSGYSRIPNFGQYANMPHSICMKKDLE